MSATLIVARMTCEHYEQRVASALASVGGVEDATADREAKHAVVEGGADIDILVTAVEDAGYDVNT